MTEQTSVVPVPSPGAETRGYFARHWYGDNSLPYACFVNSILLIGLITLFLAAVMEVWSPGSLTLLAFAALGLAAVKYTVGV
ncbi:MAG: hypothetical protein RBS88_11180 [Spongiibacteraceae bacterium]|jgi:hypothetical protein|nr:hypothetical protein [Spongiibacteraceae bacterium]